MWPVRFQSCISIQYFSVQPLKQPYTTTNEFLTLNVENYAFKCTGNNSHFQWLASYCLKIQLPFICQPANLINIAILFDKLQRPYLMNRFIYCE